MHNNQRGIGLVGSLVFLVLVGILVVMVCSQMIDQSGSSSGSATKLSESGPQYQSQVYEHVKVVMEDPDIDTIRVDRSLLYIDFCKPQSKREYQLVASTNATKFSVFKLSKLGVSGVTVFCTYGGKVQAQASARKGKVTELR